MSSLKSKLSKLSVIYFFISSIFYVDSGSCAKPPSDAKPDLLPGEILLIKNTFKISDIVDKSIGIYELFSPDKQISVTICKKKDTPDSPDKEHLFFLTKTKTGLVPNFYYCFPTQDIECPNGLFYFSEGAVISSLELLLTNKGYPLLRGSHKDAGGFTYTKSGKFKKMGISETKTLSFSSDEYSEPKDHKIHPFNFLTDKMGEISLNEPTLPLKDNPKAILPLHEQLLILKEDLTKLKQKLATLQTKLANLKDKLGVTIDPANKEIGTWRLCDAPSFDVRVFRNQTGMLVGEITDALGKIMALIEYVVTAVDEKYLGHIATITFKNARPADYFWKESTFFLEKYTPPVKSEELDVFPSIVIKIPGASFPIYKFTEKKIEEMIIAYKSKWEEKFGKTNIDAQIERMKKLPYQADPFKVLGAVGDEQPLPDDIEFVMKAFFEVLQPINQGKLTSIALAKK